MGGTNIRCLLAGLIEIRSAFFFTSKEPNPCTAITLPSSSSCIISDSKEPINSEVLINCSEKELEIGKFYQVEVVDADDFDLYAKILNKYE